MVKYFVSASVLLCGACGPCQAPAETSSSETNETAASDGIIDITDTGDRIDRPAHDPARALNPFEGYDDNWYISFGWPGEYPPGFAIVADGVTVMGRKAMALDAPVDQSCPLGKNAVYQQWNQQRAEADDLDFRTASQITEVIFPSGGTIAAVPEADESLVPQQVTLNVPANGSIGYLRYVAEGFFLMEFDGEEYQTLENELPEDVVFNNESTEDDLWLQTNCTNGSRVWLTLSDALKTDGINEWDIQGYGEASDLTP
ncbi:MAG: hypothetical protein AAFV54_10015 [Pseudomonadota bacterium]